MKNTVVGKQHLEGISKKTGNPYSMNIVHFTAPEDGVIGVSCNTQNLDPITYPFDSIQVGKEYDLQYNRRGYVTTFALIR